MPRRAVYYTATASFAFIYARHLLIACSSLMIFIFSVFAAARQLLSPLFTRHSYHYHAVRRCRHVCSPSQYRITFLLLRYRHFSPFSKGAWVLVKLFLAWVLIIFDILILQYLTFRANFKEDAIFDISLSHFKVISRPHIYGRLVNI